ncbi:uncharacterized protein K460DRAFT_304465 [Cucurbitaria berberidis CBS 394.84]|uniref:Uncharacterized protein n=1 Tax=Cucurbitaria berberidis CBS 394.84 TaxID=1168544 RepID=A0A9P4LBA9_9PLEO|nr:uncharacterized protein K460DRAFT_304465 [Cucurbitaria berberidis CBS 394.84]KAF1848885.1 hypothetical protein K460DRAFT_304465 [Cucurbitaria berberidis CBS 394.84]
MSLTHDQLVALHVQAAQLLEFKLRKVPARVFPSGRKPTITDVYTNAESLQTPDIHPNLRLLFLFENYNKFAVAGFRARKKEQDLVVSMATFYWQMDQQHSLSYHHKEIRFNVLLAHIVLETPNSRAQMDPELLRFLQVFIHAWLESAMRSGKYDLIQWTKGTRDRMSKAVKALEASVPPQAFDVEDFWIRASSMPSDEYKKHGPAWAMQYVIYKEKEAKVIDKMERDYDAQESLKHGDFFAGFGKLGMGDAAPGYLSEQMFQQPLVKALLTEVHGGMVVQDPETVEFWMDPSTAIDLVEGKVAGMDDINERIKGMSFLGASK